MTRFVCVRITILRSVIFHDHASEEWTQPMIRATCQQPDPDISHRRAKELKRSRDIPTSTRIAAGSSARFFFAQYVSLRVEKKTSRLLKNVDENGCFGKMLKKSRKIKNKCGNIRKKSSWQQQVDIVAHLPVSNWVSH